MEKERQIEAAEAKMEREEKLNSELQAEKIPFGHLMGVSENVVYPIVPNGVHDHYLY